MTDTQVKIKGIFQPKGSPFWYCRFYFGHEIKETCRNRKTGERLLATEENLPEAGRYRAERLKQVIGEQRGGDPFIGPSQSRITVNELLDDLEATYCRGGKRGIRREVSAQMKSQIKALREYFGERRAVSVNDKVVDGFVKALLDAGKEPATINRLLSYLQQAYRIAATSTPRKIGHALHVHLLHEDNVRTGKFSPEQAAQIAYLLPEHLSDVARFAYETGARVGEILKLEWGYIDGDGITVPAEDTKARTARTIAITPELETIIARRRTARADGCNLIFHRDGKPIVTYRKPWLKACLALGLGALYCRACRDAEGEYISKLDAKHHCQRCGAVEERPKYIGKIFHDFRRSAAHEMWRAGNTAEDCMAVTGHATQNMFRRYADLFSEEERRAKQRAVQQRRAEWKEQQQLAALPSVAVN